jgi:hypothetical protein
MSPNQIKQLCTVRALNYLRVISTMVNYQFLCSKSKNVWMGSCIRSSLSCRFSNNAKNDIAQCGNIILTGWWTTAPQNFITTEFKKLFISKSKKLMAERFAKRLCCLKWVYGKAQTNNTTTVDMLEIPNINRH